MNRLVKFVAVAMTAGLTLLTALAVSAAEYSEGKNIWTYESVSGGAVITGWDHLAGFGGALTIPLKVNGLNVVGISDYAFLNETEIATMYISDSVTAIGEGAFSGCNLLTHLIVGNGLREIGPSMFSGLTSLEYIKIGSGVTNIAACTFEICSSLQAIDFSEGLVSIGDNAFNGCSALSVVNLPDSLRELGYAAFQDCSDIDELSFGTGLEEIPADAFFGCTSLTEITLPDNIAFILDEAFAGCTSLETVNGGDGVVYLAPDAFAGTPFREGRGESGLVVMGTTVIGLKGTCPEDLVIAPPITRIADGAFEGCSEIVNLSLSEPLAEIGAYAFADCTGLVEVIIPDSVTYIGPGAFEGCTSLTNVTLGSGLDAILEDTFKDCSALEHVYIPDSVQYVAAGAFSGCTSLTDVEGGAGILEIEPGAFDGTPFWEGDGTPGVITFGTTVFGPRGVCPAFIDFTGMTRIAAYAFENCTGLIGINLSDSVAEIGIEAFSGCTSLASVDGGEGLTYVGENAFAGTPFFVTGEDGFVLLGTMVLGYRGAAPAVLELPQEATGMAECAFEGLSGVTSVSIPKGVREVPYRAFADCTSLADVVFAGTSTAVWSDVFEGCSALASATLSAEGFEVAAWLSDYGEVFPADVSAFKKIYYEEDGEFWTFILLPRMRVTAFPTADYSGTYDGAVHTIGDVVPAGVEGASVTYSTEQFGSFGETKPGYSNVMDQEVWYRVESANCLTWTNVSRVVITPKTVVAAWIAGVPPQVETGSAIEPEPEVADPALGVLVKNRDFVYSYANNRSAGQATVTVSGIGNYAGSVPSGFVIKTIEQVTLEEAFDESGEVTPSEGGWNVRMVADMTGPVVLPDNLGALTVDLNGFNIVGTDGRTGTARSAGGDGLPAIEVMACDRDGACTVLSLKDSSGDDGFDVVGGRGGDGYPAGNGGAGVYLDPEAKAGTKVNVGAGVSVCGGAGGNDLSGSGKGGDGGPGIDGDVGTNDGEISGGDGGNSEKGDGGDGGDGVTGDAGYNNGTIIGGDGGESVDGDGGAGGRGVRGDVETNTGDIVGGVGGASVNGDGGNGGAGVGGNVGTNVGAISGGAGGTSENGTGGRGGRGVEGDVDANEGSVSGGTGGKSTNGVDGEDGESVGGEVGGGSGSTAKLLVPAPVLPNLVYTGAHQTADVTETDWWAVVANAGGVHPGGYSVTLRLKDPANYAWSTAPGADLTLQYEIYRLPYQLTRSETGAFVATAMVYDGYLMDSDGAVCGTVQVKVMKPNFRTGECKFKATVVRIGQKKVIFNGVTINGTPNVESKGHRLRLSIGGYYMSGSYDDLLIDGARNAFSGKSDSRAAILDKWIGPMTIAMRTATVSGSDAPVSVGTYSGLSVTVGKKGAVKITGVLADGQKVSAKSQLIAGETCCCIPVCVPLYSGKTGGFAFNIWLDDDGFMTVENISPWSARNAKMPFTATFDTVVEVSRDIALQGAHTAYIVDAPESFAGIPVVRFESGAEVPFTSDGKKWTLPKAGTIKADKDAGVVVVTKGEDNPMGVKLSYAAKTGLLKGSVNIYTFDMAGRKLKKYAFKINGVVVGGKGYGTATLKKPAASWPITIE